MTGEEIGDGPKGSICVGSRNEHTLKLLYELEDPAVLRLAVGMRR